MAENTNTGLCNKFALLCMTPRHYQLRVKGPPGKCHREKAPGLCILAGNGAREQPLRGLFGGRAQSHWPK